MKIVWFKIEGYAFCKYGPALSTDTEDVDLQGCLK